ncbi:MAG TPA: serine/threonine-protein kinase [Holophagaceae bacterium]|nr:serine/threonine-protein kinase [Holophagaceae bacterium]
MSSDPQTIGRYQVIRLLGEGGMGAVYLCQDPLLKRQVAVKTVLAGRADSADMLERFQRESEISARLNHPNIVTVFDVGDDPGLGPFMTMEFVDGSSMASLIQAGPVQPATAVDLLAQTAQALGAAAKAGVIHRDIKPENMLVSREGVLKLTDFGVAKEETSTSLTTTGMLVGTPTHTAPELLSGDKASPATDRYAFAVTAFQLLNRGVLPHKGATIHALMSHIVNSPPELPPDMPNAAARVFLKALHREPERRYITAQAFLEDLADAYGVMAALPARPVDRTPTPLSGDMVTQDMPTPTDFAPHTAANTPRSRARKDMASASRLMGPPSDLFRNGEGGDDLPAPSELAKQIRVGSVAPTVQAQAGRVHLPPLPPVQPKSHKGLLVTAALVLAGLAGWNYLRSHQAQPVQAAPAAPLAPAGFTSVTTDPPGAKVYLGGREVGTTPMDLLSIPATSKEVRVEKLGYKPWKGKLGPSDALPGTIKLEPGEGPR